MKICSEMKIQDQLFPPEQKVENINSPWITLAPDGAPYFVTETCENWTPIGQNDAVNWPDLNNLFNRKDVQQVENYLIWLKAHGVTMLRLMLEYCQDNYRYFEKPAGTFNPKMVKFWDDLFFLCEKHGLRVLLTPVDTYWMWLRWKHHPYNKKNGGPSCKRSEWIICRDTIEAIKTRLAFATRRWGGSGTLFAWDLWNEIHPAHCGGKTEYISSFISEISDHLRMLELELYGKSHLQTVSVFGPLLEKHPDLTEVIFHHPSLDFATSHFYDTATINNPKDTVKSAIVVGQLVREAIKYAKERPFLDSEHGPIHAFKDRKRTLSESFDDEYFKHIQWAHLASGGAGGGMRWPNRFPHILTQGMRRSQSSLRNFLNLPDWKNFRRKNLNEEVKISSKAFAKFCCGDPQQAVLYLLRKDSTKKKMVDKDAVPVAVKIIIPDLQPGSYLITEFDTERGEIKNSWEEINERKDSIKFEVKEVVTDVVIAVKLLYTPEG